MTQRRRVRGGSRRAVPKREELYSHPGSFWKSVKRKTLEDTELGRMYGKRKIRQKAEGRKQNAEAEVRRGESESQFGEDGVENSRQMLTHISYSVK